MIVKKNHQRKEQYLQELQMFELLEGKNITLEMINSNETTLSFEQIAGKYDLFTMHQKSYNTDTFEVFFLLMLEKLNQMHKLGIAHGDIKPQNILISYQNEPFFIDFDSSVILSDYQNYLKSFTYNYNLNVYVQKVQSKKEYIIKKFENKEEVKLCDQTQLALTFLYLFCQNQHQINLFKRKEYNQLISVLNSQRSTNKNREIVIFTISSILNQADPSINIIVNQEKQMFLINYSNINEQLIISNDIDFNNREDAYKVKRIDKFSVKVLILLESMGYKLQVTPNEMIIIPQVEMEEYKLFCQNHNQIIWYQKQLINYNQFENNDLNNLFYYLNTLKDAKCKILLSEYQCNKKIFDMINNANLTDTISIKFKFKLDFLKEFIEIVKQELVNFKIQILKQGKSDIKCVIRKTKELLIKKIEFIYQIIENETIIQFLNYAKQNNYIIQQLIITSNITNVDVNMQNQFQQQQQLVNKIIELAYREQSQLIIKEFQQQIRFFLEEYQQNSFQQQLNKIYLDEYYEISEQSQQIFPIKKAKTKNELYFIIYSYFQIYWHKYSYVNQDLKEQFLIEILQNFKQDDFKCNKEIHFIFYEHLFGNTQTWLELKQNMKTQSNNCIKLQLINCVFTQSVIDILKEILQENFGKVKLEFRQYNQGYNPNFLNEIKINFNIHQSTNERLNILFQIAKNNLRFIQYQQQSNEQYLQKNILKQQKQLQQFDKKDPNQYGIKILQFDKKDPNQRYFSNQFLNSLKNLILPKQVLTKILYIQQKNIQQIINFDNKQDVKSFFEKLKNQIYHYQYVHLTDQNSQFIFSEAENQNKIIFREIKINFRNEQSIQSTFEDLFLQIDTTYHFFQTQKFKIEIDNYNRVFYQRLVINNELEKQEIYVKNKQQMMEQNNQQKHLINIQLNIEFNDNNFYRSLKCTKCSNLNFYENQKRCAECVNNINQILKENAFDELQNFEQKYYFIYQYLLLTYTLNYFIIYFNFNENKKNSDKQFKIMFQATEKLFTHNFKIYEINNNIKIDGFYSIYKIIYLYTNQHIQFSFNFQKDLIDLIKFIKLVILDQPTHAFQFKIKVYYFDVVFLNYIKNEFKNKMNILEEKEQLTLEYQPSKSPNNSDSIFTFIFYLLNMTFQKINIDDFEIESVIIEKFTKLKNKIKKQK